MRRATWLTDQDAAFAIAQWCIGLNASRSVTSWHSVGWRSGTDDDQSVMDARCPRSAGTSPEREYTKLMRPYAT